MYQPSKNKIVEYYSPNDKRLGEYYLGHAKLLGLDKHPFGLDQHGTLRFEELPSKSQIWLDHQTQDLNQIWINYQHHKYSIEDMMQFCREMGYSLCGFVDAWTESFCRMEDTEGFSKALEKLKSIKTEEEARQEVLEMIFMGHLDSVEDEILFQYRKKAKKIINDNFGPDAWKEFVNSIKGRHQ